MSLTVVLDAPQLVTELVDELLHSRCVAQVVDEGTIQVLHVDARGPEEAYEELVFFLRAWQARHPHVTVRVPAQG